MNQNKDSQSWRKLKPDFKFQLTRSQKIVIAPLFDHINQRNPKTLRFDQGMLSGSVLAVIERDGNQVDQ